VDIRIDRLRLQASGMNQDTAREFGRLLAEHLATIMAATPPGSSAARLASLRVCVPGSAGQHPGGLALVTAAEISRALRTATAGTATAGTATAGTATAGTATAGTAEAAR
jgi:hypothetical protein